MSKTATAILCGLALSVSSTLPVLALTIGAPDVLRGVVVTPVRLAWFSAGTVIGTPIAMVRKTVDNTVDTHKSLSEKSEHKVLKAGACLVALPVGVFTGTLEGLYLGVENSWKNSNEPPFKKEMFSLGELKD